MWFGLGIWKPLRPKTSKNKSDNPAEEWVTSQEQSRQKPNIGASVSGFLAGPCILPARQGLKETPCSTFTSLSLECWLLASSHPALRSHWAQPIKLSTSIYLDEVLQTSLSRFFPTQSSRVSHLFVQTRVVTKDEPSEWTFDLYTSYWRLQSHQTQPLRQLHQQSPCCEARCFAFPKLTSGEELNEIGTVSSLPLPFPCLP